MSKQAWFAAAVTLGSPAIASADVVNGSFEQQYQGWSLTKSASSPTFATAGVIRSGQTVDVGGSVLDYADDMSVANYSSGLPIEGTPTDGDYQALFLQNGPSTIWLSQLVTLPAKPQLSFDLAYRNWDSAFSADQEVTVQVLDMDTHLVLANLLQTVNGTAATVPMSHQTIDLSAFENMTVKLQFEINAQHDFLDVQLDNIHVATADSGHCSGCSDVPTGDDPIADPDPTVVEGGCSTTHGGSSGMLLAALALVAVRRRRR